MVGEVIGPPRAHPLWQLTDTELDTRLTRLAAAHHTIAALRGQAALVADERDTARELGYTSAAALIADTSPLNLAQAHRITKLTARLTRLADMDEKYRPVLDAYNSDQLAGPHAELIAKFVKRNCNRIPEVAQTAVVATLLAFGADPDTQQLKNTITTLDESLDTEDGTPPACEDSDLDALHISRTLAGRVVINGDLNKLCGEMLLELMNALDVQQTGDDGTTLARTPEQLRADTFGELLRRAPAAAKLPDTGGARPNVNVTIDWETLNSDDEPGLFDDITDSHAAGETHHDGCGPHRRSPSQGNKFTESFDAGLIAAIERKLARAGKMPWGGAITRDLARMISCDATITPILTKNGRPIDMGRSARYATKALRDYLTLRDGGCAFPYCGIL